MANTQAAPAETSRRSALRYTFKVFTSNSLSVAGAIIVLAFILVGILAAGIVPYGPAEVNYSRVLEAPSGDHLFGTDSFGRDVFSRVISGAGISLRVGLTVSVVATVLGMMVGILAGYLGGTVDTAVMRVVDLFMAFPPVVIALVLAVIMGRGLTTVVVALSLSGWTGTARLARGEVLSLKDRGFMRASRVIGAGDGHIIWHHLIPNILPPILISTSLS
ncbi:MAG: ABC transporter permease, partial [Bacillota bacterium]